MLIDTAPLPGYPEPYGLLCAILQDGTKEWRAELDPDLPEDAVVWQPHPGAHSVGAILLHIIWVETYWFEQFALGHSADPEERRLTMKDETDQLAWRWPAPPRKPISWYFAFHDRIRARTLESIKKWPPADTVKQHRIGDVSLRWVFGYVIKHEAYHGGQAVLLNRLWQLRVDS